MDKFQKALALISVDNEPGLSTTQRMLVNEDLKPVEPERRQWGPWNYVGFWIADSFNINTWMISSSSIVAGLTWWQSWLCVWAGYFLAAVFVCASARIGAVYHISFPVGARASFGIWGSMWPVFNRAAMACIWYGVQSWIGGQCVTLMIRAIWPSYTHLPNSMPASSGTTTRDYVSFVLFSVGCLPIIYLPVHKVRHLFTVKAYFAPSCGIAFLAWALYRAHGAGPTLHAPPSVHGSKFGWAIVSGIMSALANFCTLIVNALDFARVAHSPRAALWSQLIAIPVGFALTSLIGILVSSSSNADGGTLVWNPLDLLGRFLDEDASSAQRFGVFVISAGFCLAQIGANVAANSISAGTDLAALFPRFITIRRGGYFCAAVGFAMCPWHLLSSSNQFTTYLSAYSVFLSSIAGPMLADYYVVRRGYLDLRHLFSSHKHYTDARTGERRRSPYYGVAGIGWQAYASYLAGIMINIVGFAGAVGARVPVGATYIYNVNYFGGFFVSAGIYCALCWLFPPPDMPVERGWHEIDVDTTQLVLGDECDVLHGMPGVYMAAKDDEESKPTRASTAVTGRS